MSKETMLDNTDAVYNRLKKLVNKEVRFGCFPGNDFIGDVYLWFVDRVDNEIHLTVKDKDLSGSLFYIDFKPAADGNAKVAFLLKSGEMLQCPSKGYSIHNQRR